MRGGSAHHCVNKAFAAYCKRSKKSAYFAPLTACFRVCYFGRKNKFSDRHPGGTRKILLSAASFRTWHGSKVSAAPDPSENLADRLPQPRCVVNYLRGRSKTPIMIMITITITPKMTPGKCVFGSITLGGKPGIGVGGSVPCKAGTA